MLRHVFFVVFLDFRLFGGNFVGVIYIFLFTYLKFMMCCLLCVFFLILFFVVLSKLPLRCVVWGPSGRPCESNGLQLGYTRWAPTM